jgi:putative ABC transport system substrate-binding protein
MSQKHIAALYVSPDIFFVNRRVQLVILVVQHKVPTIYFTREFPEIGGLMSYGPSQTDLSP